MDAHAWPGDQQQSWGAKKIKMLNMSPSPWFWEVISLLLRETWLRSQKCPKHVASWGHFGSFNIVKSSELANNIFVLCLRISEVETCFGDQNYV